MSHLWALAAFGIFNDPAALELYGIIWNIYGIYMEICPKII
jgi:hypothetical protein